jgi:D-2-hydroxyacid dehydrogenase (NADP+)
MTTNVLMLLAMPEKVRMQYFNGIREKFPELKLDVVDHVSKVDPYIESADVLITFGPHLAEGADQVFSRARNLKWVQALGTGVDNIADRPGLGKDVLVTNIHGIHGAPMSEAAFMAMLALSRDLPRVVRNQDRHAWDRWPAKLLSGKTVGIFGVGAIAEALAPRCKTFGMKVIGISSSRREVAGFDEMRGREELREVVRELDYLVLLTPYTAQTHNIVNAEILSSMKPTSFLLNLARGGVVDEEALLTALTDGRIAGAALDVFSQEPLPGDNPLWAMKNVIITPHLGGLHDRYVDDALPVIEKNLRAFLAGDTGKMINLVAR